MLHSYHSNQGGRRSGWVIDRMEKRGGIIIVGSSGDRGGRIDCRWWYPCMMTGENLMGGVAVVVGGDGEAELVVGVGGIAVVAGVVIEIVVDSWGVSVVVVERRVVGVWLGSCCRIGLLLGGL